MSFLLRLSSREKSGIKIVGVFHAFTRRTGKLSEHRTFPPSPSFFGFKRVVLGNILRCFARCIGLSRRFVVLNFTNFELLTQVTSINHQMSGGVLASCKGWKLFPVQLIIFGRMKSVLERATILPSTDSNFYPISEDFHLFLSPHMVGFFRLHGNPQTDVTIFREMNAWEEKIPKSYIEIALARFFFPALYTVDKLKSAGYKILLGESNWGFIDEVAINAIFLLIPVDPPGPWEVFFLDVTRRNHQEMACPRGLGDSGCLDYFQTNLICMSRRATNIWNGNPTWFFRQENIYLIWSWSVIDTKNEDFRVRMELIILLQQIISEKNNDIFIW